MAKGRILAVDDQRYFRELIEGLLVEEGYEVQTVESGEEALRVLEHSVFDLVITDLVMPVMNGTDLVFRVKQQDPEQEIMVVTGVVDVSSAVEAMKLGATDYLLKPFDRVQLSSAVDGILKRTRLRADHDRLLAENLEFMGERALLERALGLMSAMSFEGLADKILEALCEETGAQSGVLWHADREGPAGLRLAAARGLVRTEDEPAMLAEDAYPDAPGSDDQTPPTASADLGDAEGRTLWVTLRNSGARAVLIRISDKLGGDRFDELDLACAETLAKHAATAYRNVHRATHLERRSLQDPETGAYHYDVLHDVVRNEIEKANRFGRRFGLLQVTLEPLDTLRQNLGEEVFRGWHDKLVRYLGRYLRSTDLLAVEEPGRLCVMLAETDAIGAATFKQRIREALEAGEPLAGLTEAERPQIALGVAVYPGDATQQESLLAALAAHSAADRLWRAPEARLAALPWAGALAELLEGAEDESVESVASLMRFLVAELGRRPKERNLLFLRPGPAFDAALIEGLARRHDPGAPGDLVVIGEPGGPGLAAEGVTWISPGRVEAGPPFAVQFGDGPSYVWVAESKDADGEARLFHSADPALAETLAFRLQRELGVTISDGGAP